MIDRETAVDWAKDAGFEATLSQIHRHFIASPENIQALITRAQNEALERAAQLFCQPSMEYFGADIQDLIRELKEQP